MLFVRRPSARTLDRLLDQAQAGSPTFAAVGATEGGDVVEGYRRDVDEVSLGSGSEVFDHAVAAVRGWEAQRGAGVEVVPTGVVVEVGQTVLLLIRVARFWAVAPCRVVSVRDDADHFRFAYATLPGHPEQGEAAFEVTRGVAGDVVFQVASFSRPVDPLARLAKPLTRRIQRRVTLRYLTAIRSAAAR